MEDYKNIKLGNIDMKEIMQTPTKLNNTQINNMDKLIGVNHNDFIGIDYETGLSLMMNKMQGKTAKERRKLLKQIKKEIRASKAEE